MKIIPRRELLRTGLQLFSVATVIPLVSGAANAAGACVDPASQSLREALNYTDEAPDPAHPCKDCGFFTAAEGTPACGHCEIFNGPVSPKGHCESFGARDAKE